MTADFIQTEYRIDSVKLKESKNMEIIDVINTIQNKNCLEGLKMLPDKSIHCCVTSPPYWGLRDYGVSEQMGLEKTPEEYVAKMVEVFREVRRVLRDDGTLWLNLGDSYNGNKKGNTEKNKNPTRVTDTFEKKLWNGAKEKDLIGIPWRVAFALQADGWYLRSDIVWSKPNPMPESVTDRPTKSHEYIFLLSKSPRYYYDAEAIKEPAIYFDDDRKGFNDKWDNLSKAEQCSAMRNKRSVWTVATHPYAGAHFATFPQKLIVDCIKAGCPVDGIVLDPFGGAGTTAVVARKLDRKFILYELNPAYVDLSKARLRNELGLFK